MSSTLERHQEALTLCTYCPSLCRHMCPVSTEEARDSSSPWGLMSLADHVINGRLRLTSDVARAFYHCTGCGACTTFCLHDSDVAEVLVAARRFSVARGRAPFPRERFAHADADADSWWRSGAKPGGRFRAQPSVLLLPGHQSLLRDPAPVVGLLELCERLDEDELACGESSRLDVGYDLWSAGFHDEFATRARRVRDALAGARYVVVMSPVALYTLRELYPRVDATIDADVVHSTEFLLPRLSGAVIERVPGRVAYHDACHLARHLDTVDVPREVLRRVLAEAPVELHRREKNARCCGGAGCLPLTAPDTARAMAEAVIGSALEVGADRLLTFAPECLTGLREAAGDRLRVDAAITAVAEAVRGDGAV